MTVEPKKMICDKCNLDKTENDFELRVGKKRTTRRKTCNDCMKAYKRQKNEERRIALGKAKYVPAVFVGKNKTCAKCDESKDISDFPIRDDSPDGYNNQCKSCKSSYISTYRADRQSGVRELVKAPEIIDECKICTKCNENKPLADFKTRADIKHGYRYECRKCMNAMLLKWQRQRIKDDSDFCLRRHCRAITANGVLRETGRSAFEEIVGADLNFVRAWFEYRFETDGGMSWDNYARDNWSIDHVISLSLFDLTDPEQLQIAFNWKNVQPSKTNFIKRNRFIPEEYEQHIERVIQFIIDQDLPQTEYQSLAEMQDWLRANLRYGNKLTDTFVETKEMDDPQPSS